jgi:predicted Zn-dependent protease
VGCAAIAAALACCGSASYGKAPKPKDDPKDKDQTLRAMQDEMERSRTRLAIDGVQKPYYIEYRLLDLDIRTVTASFGNIISSTTGRNRVMSVDVRVGDHHLDSSNFVSEEGFHGFLGGPGDLGEVGIDGDYNSLRQDLWLATDQAYKGAVTGMSLKNAFLRSLTKPPEIDDFSQESPLVQIEPHAVADWTNRNWDAEARAASLVLRSVPQINGSRVTYYLVYQTYYLLNSEGTEIRIPHSLASVEAGIDTLADDGMPLHNYYTLYAAKPGELPDPATIAKGLQQAGQDLVALRSAPLSSDYTGPVLFDAAAASSMLTQVLPPSLSGARPALSTSPRVDEYFEQMGGHNDWSGRVGQRVLPTTVTLTDDPTSNDFQGQALLGGYDVDEEGVRGQKVTLVQNGILRNLLMSRRPGPDFDRSNGHGRSAILSEPHPTPSNLFFQSSEGMSAADLHKKFMDLCKEDGHEWCIEVRRMDNPAIATIRQEDFQDTIGGMAGGLSSGERLPLLVYRVWVDGGKEELVRGARISGLTMRSLRNIPAVGTDTAAANYIQSATDGMMGTALGAFGSAQGGLPSAIVAPSLILDDVELRGYRGEPRRLPLDPAPPLQ